MFFKVVVGQHEFTIAVKWEKDHGYGYEIMSGTPWYRSTGTFTNEYEAVQAAIHHIFPAMLAAAR